METLANILIALFHAIGIGLAKQVINDSIPAGFWSKAFKIVWRLSPIVIITAVIIHRRHQAKKRRFFKNKCHAFLGGSSSDWE